MRSPTQHSNTYRYLSVRCMLHGSLRHPSLSTHHLVVSGCCTLHLGFELSAQLFRLHNMRQTGHTTHHRISTQMHRGGSLGVHELWDCAEGPQWWCSKRQLPKPNSTEHPQARHRHSRRPSASTTTHRLLGLELARLELGLRKCIQSHTRPQNRSMSEVTTWQPQECYPWTCTSRKTMCNARE